jgi:hypothetical protein
MHDAGGQAREATFEIESVRPGSTFFQKQAAKRDALKVLKMLHQC